VAKPPFRIKPYKHSRLKFVVRSKISGKWQRRFFTSKAEAQTYVELKETELLNQGKEGVMFPSSLRVMAQREDDRLKEFGKTLTDATDFYLNHLKAASRSVSIDQAVSELLQNRKSSGVSGRYCYEIELKLKRFASSFSGRTLADISTADIDTWLEGLLLAPGSRNTYRRDLQTLFSFGMTRHYCTANPVIRAAKAKEIDEEIGILGVSEVARLLEAASDEMIPFWSIGAFAGVRRAEIERMDWSDIDFDAALIEVKARHSKTGTRRHIPMQPNLIAWLLPHQKQSGTLCPLSLRLLVDSDRERAGLKQKWPRNALRHSFGSYYLARFNDTAALALQMGNSPDIIFKHYRKLVKPRDAEKYWQIAPLEASPNIVRFGK
jgi:integrase